MFKNYSLLVVAFLSLHMTGCNQAETEQLAVQSETKQEVKSDVSAAIEQAIVNKDFRLLHSKGRRIVVPGLEQLDISLVQSQCGLKPMIKSGDVMKTTEQRQQQKAAYAFAKQFNQAVYQQCLASLKQ